MEMTPILTAEGNLPIDELKKGMEVVHGGRQARVEGVNAKHGVVALRLRPAGKTPASIIVLAFEAAEGGARAGGDPLMVFPMRKGAFPRDMFTVVKESA